MNKYISLKLRRVEIIFRNTGHFERLLNLNVTFVCHSVIVYFLLVKFISTEINAVNTFFRAECLVKDIRKK